MNKKLKFKLILYFTLPFVASVLIVSLSKEPLSKSVLLVGLLYLALLLAIALIVSISGPPNN